MDGNGIRFCAAAKNDATWVSRRVIELSVTSGYGRRRVWKPAPPRKDWIINKGHAEIRTYEE